MKKTISLLLTILLVASMCSVSVGAYRIGDVIGYALATDIAATINGYDIPSYNVDGYTYIVVEDLRYYGFAVNYDDATRSLSVSRDFSQSQVNKAYKKPFVSSDQIGKKEHKLLYTDIVTYFDGNYVPACNIGGQTIVRFDALSAYGGVSYDNNKREISVVIDGIMPNPSPVNREEVRMQAYIGEYKHTQYDSTITISKYDGKTITFEILSIGQKGNRIAATLVRESVNKGVCNFTYRDSWDNTGKGVLKILDNGKLSLSFYNTNEIGLWSVTCGAGDYTRSGDLPEDYYPLFS